MGRLRPFTICGRNATESSQNPGGFARSLFLTKHGKIIIVKGKTLTKKRAPVAGTTRAQKGGQSWTATTPTTDSWAW